MVHIFVTSIFFLAILLAGFRVWVKWLKPAKMQLEAEHARLTRLQADLRQQALHTTLEENEPVLPVFVEGRQVDLLIYKLDSQMRADLGTLDVPNAIDEVSDELYERGGWARYYAAYAVYVGLIGTIFGLWVALSDLGGATQIHDESSLRTFADSIRGLLGSLQGAFMSAMGGIAGSVAVGALLNDYDKRSSQYLSKLSDFVNWDLLPLLKRRQQGSLPTSSVEAARALVTQLDKTLSSFTRSWADRFKTLSEETGKMAEAANGLTESVTSVEAASDSLAETTATLNTRLELLYGAVADERAVLADLGQSVTRSSETVERLTAKAEGWPDIASMLGHTSAEVAEATESMTTAAVELGRSTQSLSDVLSNLHQHANDVSSESFEALTARLTEVIGHIGSSAGEEIRRIASSANARDERIEEMVRSIQQVNSRQDQYLTDLTVVVNQMLATIPALEDPTPTLQQLVRSLQQVSDSIGARAGALSPVVSSQHEPGIGSEDVKAELVAIRQRLEAITSALGAYRQLRESANLKLDHIGRVLGDRHVLPAADQDGEVIQKNGWRSWLGKK